MAALAPAVASRGALCQGRAPLMRAAIVIGVNKSGHLPVLTAAVSGARSVKGWLEGEGFEVKEFCDDHQSVVKAGPIYDAIEELVERGTLEQLVVYFSGHGFNVGYSEHWFLSGAPRNPNESISLTESVELARLSGIPNVVFISDACRSTSESLGVQHAHGSLIFPSGDTSGAQNVSVDRFFAAKPGKYALELPVEDSVKTFEGIYTSTFLQAYKSPSVDMVITVDGMRVVPNRHLEAYLRHWVQKRAEKKSIKLTQLPEARVESGEKTYIGRHKQPMAEQGTLRPPPPLVATVADVANYQLVKIGAFPASDGSKLLGGVRSQGPSELELEAVASASGFSDTVSTIQRQSRDSTIVRDRFETHTGLLVFGARLESIASLPRRDNIGSGVLLTGDGDRKPAVVRLPGVVESVILRFSDGSGTVVASLPGYICTIVINNGLVVSVNYAPSRNDSRWDAGTESRLGELRSVVAASAELGVFRIDGDRAERERGAAQLASKIRSQKGVDPTLGIYAAYAYADAGLMDYVRRVHYTLKSDLRTNVFDVAMLAGELSGRLCDQAAIVPCCPMLSRGWNLLRVRDVHLSTSFDKARSYLRPSLWTTFHPDGMKVILKELGQ